MLNVLKTNVKCLPGMALDSVELFSGCGGLAIGLSQAGFGHKLLVEWNKHAAQTVMHNKAQKVRHVKDWPFTNSDVRSIDWAPFADAVQLVAGGPPCQPFSVGGKAAGHDDTRDMWPEAIRAVREIKPMAFVFENVRGLLRPAFAEYVEWIRRYLGNPGLTKGVHESHAEHLCRLRTNVSNDLYEVKIQAVNAADYGAPQTRHRVLIVGIRKDVATQWSFPAPTHSQSRLVWDKWCTGEYWKRHGMTQPDRAAIPRHESNVLKKLCTMATPPTGRPWLTCRDALFGLEEPGMRHDIANHLFQPGARSYAGHTGSPIDEPAKALKAGVHGVPGGENMLAREDGTVRYFSVREAARLQGLPDSYTFPGSWTESMRQIGNAVPVQLSATVGEWLAQILLPANVNAKRA
jgi:DNA (cytosine-5)-methyltransferase 1